MSEEHPNRPHFVNSLSTGNVLQILVMVVAIAGSFYTVSNKADQNTRAIEELKSVRTAEANEIRRDIGDLEVRTRTLETSNARSETQLSNILNIVSQIDARMERIEQRITKP
jgi:hypothetical protein